jgi:hypothetical protein
MASQSFNEFTANSEKKQEGEKGTVASDVDIDITVDDVDEDNDFSSV